MPNTISVAVAALVVLLGTTSVLTAGPRLKPQVLLSQNVYTIDWLPEDVGKAAQKAIGHVGSAKAIPPASCPTVRTINNGSAILKGPWAPWGVQVAGNFSLEQALANFDAVQRKYPSIVVGSPLVMCSLDRSHGQIPLFQIRLPASDRKQAFDICNRLEAAGGACVVFRNGPETLAGP
jgi:hypothetical protein